MHSAFAIHDILTVLPYTLGQHPLHHLVEVSISYDGHPIAVTLSRLSARSRQRARHNSILVAYTHASWPFQDSFVADEQCVQVDGGRYRIGGIPGPWRALEPTATRHLVTAVERHLGPASILRPRCLAPVSGPPARAMREATHAVTAPWWRPPAAETGDASLLDRALAATTPPTYEDIARLGVALRAPAMQCHALWALLHGTQPPGGHIAWWSRLVTHLQTGYRGAAAALLARAAWNAGASGTLVLEACHIAERDGIAGLTDDLALPVWLPRVA